MRRTAGDEQGSRGGQATPTQGSHDAAAFEASAWSGRALKAVRESVRPAVGAAVGLGFALWSLRELARMDGRDGARPEDFASGRISQVP